MSSNLASPPSINRTRLILFAVLCVASIAGVVAYTVGVSRTRQPITTGITYSEQPTEVTALSRKPHLLFRNTALGPAYGRIALVALEAPAGTRVVTPLTADRVYGSATGGGFYLRASRRALTTYEAASFDPAFQTIHRFKLQGAPSRTRVSADGRYAASTVFVSGDSYNTGGFSTRTTLFDLQRGATVDDLEKFAVEKDGKLFTEPDFNFWGVTFAANSDVFYATLSSGDVTYLIQGSIAGRTAKVLRRGVECPSLSPDGTQIAFKSRVTENGRRLWRIHVLDLRSSAERELKETRNVDDQVEWFDDRQLLYALPREDSGGRSDLWMVPADATGAPSLYLSDAASPCVIRS